MQSIAVAISLLLAIAGASAVTDEVLADIVSDLRDRKAVSLLQDQKKLVQSEELHQQIYKDLKDALLSLDQITQEVAATLTASNTKDTNQNESALLQTASALSAEVKAQLQERLLGALEKTMENIEHVDQTSDVDEEMHDMLLNTINYGQKLVDRLGEDGEASSLMQASSTETPEDQEALEAEDEDLSLEQELAVVSADEDEVAEEHQSLEDVTEEDLNLDDDDLQASHELLDSGSEEMQLLEEEALLQDDEAEAAEEKEAEAPEGELSLLQIGEASESEDDEEADANELEESDSALAGLEEEDDEASAADDDEVADEDEEAITEEAQQEHEVQNDDDEETLHEIQQQLATEEQPISA